MRVGVACGGTGGHVFPGLAVARHLRDRGHEVDLWLAGGKMEAASLAGWDGGVVSVKSAGFPSGFSIRSLGVVFKLLMAVGRSILIMRRRRPDVLLAMGSYASVGPVLAARCYRVPVVLHEANAVAGRAVRFLSGFAARIGVTFPEASTEFGSKAVVTGLPLRSTLRHSRVETGPNQGPFTVLIMGGSQGAHVLNDIGSAAVCAVRHDGIDVSVIHLTGPADEELVKGRYDSSGVPGRVLPFLEDMDVAYRAADIAVCRSGAGTCMELAACGVPALLIPLPSARRDHQTANARMLCSAGGADMQRQENLSAAWLSAYLSVCSRDRGKLRKMGDAMHTLAVPDATERLAAVVEDTAQALH